MLCAILEPQDLLCVHVNDVYNFEKSFVFIISVYMLGCAQQFCTRRQIFWCLIESVTLYPGDPGYRQDAFNQSIPAVLG